VGATGATGATGAKGATGATGYSTLITKTAIAAGATCFNGGTRYVAGLDNGDGGGTARNGVLENGEIDTSTNVCAFVNSCLRSGSFSAVMSVTVGFDTMMSVAWDGTNYWFASGGDSDSNRLTRTNASLGAATDFSPGIDFRSVFTKTDGVPPIYASEYASMQIRRSTGPGIFTNDVVLAGSNDEQTDVEWDSTKSEFIARFDSTVYRWNSTGASLPSVTLVSAPSGEGLNSCNTGYLTYDAGTHIVRDHDKVTGAVRNLVTLNATGFPYDGRLSIANHKIWICDTSGAWQAFDALK